ncbi:MAG: hypothetical protein WCC74_00875 [Minisyncoccia bacterium]
MITIFTENSIEEPVISFIKRYLRALKKIALGKSFSLKYGGHYAVTRSLLVGLDKLQVNYNYNPTKIDDLNKIVLVLSNIRALKTAIKLKQNGKIKKLFAGPNIINDPADEKELLSSKEIDKFIVNSDWTKELYGIAVPELINKLSIWPAGVDEEYWSPKPEQKNKKALVYWKNGTRDFYQSVVNILTENGWKISTIKYGKYKEKEFNKKLSDVSISIFLSNWESQGLALAESWAMDIPTLVFNPKTIYEKYQVETSSSPYLSKDTGYDWKDINELNYLLKNENLMDIHPRKWLLENMTDKICAQKLLNIIYEKTN